MFEKNPLTTETDFKLDIKLLPVQIHYNEEIFSELLDFLFLPQMDCLQVTWGFIYQGYKYGLQFSRFIQNCLTSRVLCDLNIDLQNPCLLINQYGKLSKVGSTVILDCGNLKIGSSMLNDKDTISPSMNNQRRIYDEFNFFFSGIQVIQTPNSIDWNSVREEPSSEYHIIPKTKIHLTLSNSILHSQDIPAWKLNTFIKCAKLNLSDSKLSNIIDFLRDLPLPSRNKNMKKNLIKAQEWKIDKRWIIPSIGKLELLYLENHLTENEINDEALYSLTSQKPHEIKKETLDSTSTSETGDFDIKQYCREIDLPGFEDNISTGNKMIAVVQICVKDMGLIFDRASGAVDRSYLYVGATNVNLDIGFLEHGPAIQLGFESLKLMDRQAGVDLVSVTPATGQDQVSCQKLLQFHQKFI